VPTSESWSSVPQHHPAGKPDRLVVSGLTGSLYFDRQSFGSFLPLAS
jgi:hypothetical protein